MAGAHSRDEELVRRAMVTPSKDESLFVTADEKPLLRELIMQLCEVAVERYGAESEQVCVLSELVSTGEPSS